MDVSPDSGGLSGPASGLGLRCSGTAMTSRMSEGLYFRWTIYNILCILDYALTLFFFHVKSNKIVTALYIYMCSLDDISDGGNKLLCFHGCFHGSCTLYLVFEYALVRWNYY